MSEFCWLDALWAGALCGIWLSSENLGQGIVGTAAGAAHGRLDVGFGRPLCVFDQEVLAARSL